MTKSKIDRPELPVDDELDSEVISFRDQFDQKSPLDELVREAARRMLQSAIDAEVDTFIARHSDRRDPQDRRQVVKNGNLPEREILTGAGAIPVTQGRVRDNHPDPNQRVTFSPSVLPSYLRRTAAIEELIPWLYLKGIDSRFRRGSTITRRRACCGFERQRCCSAEGSMVCRMRCMEQARSFRQALRLCLGRWHLREGPTRRRCQQKAVFTRADGCNA